MTDHAKRVAAIATRIYLERLRRWPETDTESLVNDSIEAAEMIIKAAQRGKKKT